MKYDLLIMLYAFLCLVLFHGYRQTKKHPAKAIDKKRKTRLK